MAPPISRPGSGHPTAGGRRGQQGRPQGQPREAVRRYTALSDEGLRYLTSSYILPQVAFPAAASSLPPLRGVTFTGARSPSHSPTGHAHHGLCHLSNLARHLRGASDRGGLQKVRINALLAITAGERLSSSRSLSLAKTCRRWDQVATGRAPAAR